MQTEIDFYNSKLQDLYSQLGTSTDFIQDLQESKKKVISAIEKIEEEKNLLKNLENSLENSDFKSLHHSNSLPESSEFLKISSGSDSGCSEEPKIERFLKELKELKAVCQQQGEALVKFQETMESTKEDNERLQHFLNEFDNEKGYLSREVSQSNLIFDNLPSPVKKGSPDSSMFVSVIEMLSDKKDSNCIQEVKLFHRQPLGLIQRFMISSHVPALKV